MFGREAELLEVEALLQRARHGFAALVLEGDPGIGKTSVWRAGIATAAGLGARVLSCRASPAEARLSFTALGDLLASVEPAAFDTLPDPQRRALDAALLRTDAGGSAPNARAIGTGLVTLLSTLAGRTPLLVAIDDVQWLDLPSAHALGFALRRLEAHPVALIATRRLGVRGAADALLARERIRALRVGPLSLAALYRIIEARLDRRLPRPLLARIERASGGNPFFALEIARALGTGGRPAAGEELPIPDDLSQLVTERLRGLPRRTREALLRVSALAHPTLREVAVVHLEPAEEAGIVRVRPDGRVEFTHPLFAGGIYAAAPRERRRRLHAELAEVASDIEESARHLMLASERGTEDERAAALLHEAAEHALARGALTAAAELEERAAELTPAAQVADRQQRSLRAARHLLEAGDPERSRALCRLLLDTSPPPAMRADFLHVLAGASIIERPRDAIPLLTEALACAGDDVVRGGSLEMALGVALASVFDLPGSLRHTSRAADLAEQSGDTALLAEAVATREFLRVMSGERLDERALERALALEDFDRAVTFQMRPSLSAAAAHLYAGRADDARPVLENLRDRLIARGAESEMPWTLCLLAVASLLAGDFERGEREASEAERVSALSARELVRGFALLLRTMLRSRRGDAAGARADAAATLALSTRNNWAHGSIAVSWALGQLALSEGDPAQAARALAPGVQLVEATGAYEWPIAMGLPDAIEAFVATGEVDHAERIRHALAEAGGRFDRAWVLATSSRGEALLAAAAGDFSRARAAADAALAEHERLSMPFERARTLLVKGQVQRRAGERRAARVTLEEAHTLFRGMGAALWAERARAEIARIGVRRAPAELTESEQRVADLAAAGHTNPEIAARLFMSRRTVEANLARAYRKLEIGSRAELGAVMAGRKARVVLP
jgi:DNA-binding CsgD family transcriptional regulator